MRHITLSLLLLSSTIAFSQDTDYLHYVKTHCDNLIEHGRDNYGSVSNNLIASVIDTRDMSVPKANVPPTEGTRAHDRAVGGSNFYHDVETIKLFLALSELTGEGQYQTVVESYARDFLKYCQNPATGLLAWGEHLYYNFYADSVMVGDLENPRDDIYHEFLAETPPWEFLWDIDTAAVRKAISGVRYHFRSPTTQTFLFNRHARWQKVDKHDYRGLAQYQDGGQPWIKHSGLQCYSFSFLYSKTEKSLWKKWAEGAGSLYWKYRNPETNLTVSCIDDPRDVARYASLSQTSLLCYYWLKSAQQHPEFNYLRERAEVMLKSVEKYSWNSEESSYYSLLHLNGKALNEDLIPVIFTGYGGSDVIQFGRVAAYFYLVTQDPAYKEMVNKVADMLLKTDWPDDFVVNSLASALQFSLDAHEILEDDRLLQSAQNYASIAIEKLWSGHLFIRQPNDTYYEAKLETNNLVAGLLRLHLTESNQANHGSLTEWSF